MVITNSTKRMYYFFYKTIITILMMIAQVRTYVLCLIVQLKKL